MFDKVCETLQRDLLALRRKVSRKRRPAFVLSFITPLLNGQGNCYIESQFTDMRRMDVVVDFEGQQIIVELKLWRGEAAHEETYEQLLGYMDSKNAKEGFLLTIDFLKQKTEEYKNEWKEFGGKRIFDVVV